jgi:hypothetical protein
VGRDDDRAAWQGRWHSARLEALAEEVGIRVEKDPRIGWSPTTPTAETSTSYAQVIAELGAVLRQHRAVEVPAGGAPRRARRRACACDRKIGVVKTVLAAGPIGTGSGAATLPSRQGARHATKDLCREQRGDLSCRMSQHCRERSQVDLVDPKAGDRARERSCDGSVGEERGRDPEGVGDAFAFGLGPPGFAYLQ